MEDLRTLLEEEEAEEVRREVEEARQRQHQWHLQSEGMPPTEGSWAPHPQYSTEQETWQKIGSMNSAYTYALTETCQDLTPPSRK